jgi:hypothetical protein
MSDAGARPKIETFRGDWAELEQMMQVSWSSNREQPMRYTQQFLRSAFDYPGSNIDLAPSIYSGETLKAFVGGFPRTARLWGRPVRLLLNSFLTASLEARKSGYGLILWRALLDRAEKAGYQGTINFCVQGDEMNEMMPAVARLFRLNTQQIYTVEYLSRFLRPAEARELLPASDLEIELFCELAAEIVDNVPLARTWTYAEAEWQCRNRCDAISASLKEGGHRGMLTGYAMEAGTPTTRVAMLEDLFWGDLDDSQRRALLRNFLDAAAARQCQVVSCPVLGYSSVETLTATGFRRSHRVLHTYLTLWNDQTPRQVSSIYVDVV